MLKLEVHTAEAGRTTPQKAPSVTQGIRRPVGLEIPDCGLACVTAVEEISVSNAPLIYQNMQIKHGFRVERVCGCLKAFSQWIAGVH
jgi:hypothetical protein